MIFFGFRKYRLFITFDFVEATDCWQKTNRPNWSGRLEDWKRNLLQPATFTMSLSIEIEKWSWVGLIFKIHTLWKWSISLVLCFITNLYGFTHWLILHLILSILTLKVINRKQTFICLVIYWWQPRLFLYFTLIFSISLNFNVLSINEFILVFLLRFLGIIVILWQSDVFDTI